MRSPVAFVLSLAALAAAAGGLAAQSPDVQWKVFTDAGWRATRDGDQPKAREYLNKALQVAEGFGPDDARRGLDLAYLALAAAREGKRDEAERFAGEALAVYDRQPADSKPAYMGRGLNALSMIYTAPRDFERADALLRRAIAAEEAAAGPESVPVAQLLANRAAALESRGRYEEAEPLRKRSAAIFDGPAGKDRPLAALAARQQLGRFYRRWGHAASAEQPFARALELARKLPAKDDRKLAEHLADLGGLYLDLKKFDKSEPLLKEAVRLWESFVAAKPEDQAGLAQALHELGSMFLAKEWYLEAEPYLERALAIRDKLNPAGDAATAATLRNLASLHSAQKTLPKAAAEYLRALAIKDKLWGRKDVRVAAAEEDVAFLYARTTDWQTSARHFRAALEIREAVLGPAHPSVAATLHHLANLYRDERHYREAESLYRRSLEIKEKGLGPDAPTLAAVLEDYAKLLKATHRQAEADQQAARAKAIRGKSKAS